MTLLEAARAGREDAFEALLRPLLPQIRLHCYRMLGSFHDAEEAVQEVMVAAWRSLHTYEGRAPLAHWLMRIATNTCLKAIESRARQPATVAEVEYLEPYPDRLLDPIPVGGDPAAEAERRESVSLAFIAALQLLPPTQRAALILHDVLSWRSDEVADLLGSTVPAVNSLLQRARVTVSTVDGTGPRRPLDATDDAVLAAFVDAWHRRDIPGLAAVLHQDVVMRMPPAPMVVTGRDALAEFYSVAPLDGRLDELPLVVTRSNGQLAVAAFEWTAAGAWSPYGLMVFDIVDGLIVSVVGFPGFTRPALDAAFGLRPLTQS